MPKSPRNNGKSWSSEDDDIVLNGKGSHRTKARALGRTEASIGARKRTLLINSGLKSKITSVRESSGKSITVSSYKDIIIDGRTGSVTVKY